MTATTISPAELRRSLDELESVESQQRAEQQRQAVEAAQRAEQQRQAEINATLDRWKSSAPIAPVVEGLDTIQAAVPTLAAAIDDRTSTVRQMIANAHAVKSNRMTLGPNAAWLVIDRERISTQRAEIGTEVAALCAEILRAAGETYLERECRARVRAGNRLSRPSGEQREAA